MQLRAIHDNSRNTHNSRYKQTPKTNNPVESPRKCDYSYIGQWSIGRVEKSKNGINSYGYCFLLAFWYVETGKNIFFGQRKFFVGWNLT